MDTVQLLGQGEGSFGRGHKVSAYKTKLYQQMLIQREKERIAREKDREFINLLLKTLRDHDIEVPDPNHDDTEMNTTPLLPDGSAKALTNLLNTRKGYRDAITVTVHFKNLGFWKMAPQTSIPTVGQALKQFLFGSGPKRRIDVLNDITGTRYTCSHSIPSLFYGY